MTTAPGPGTDTRTRVDAAVAALESRLGSIPRVAIVLGSGLGAFASRVASSRVIPYAELPHWPQSNVIGHAGRLVSGTVGGRPVLLLSGRAHLYEGHDPSTVVFATRVLARAGVRVLVLTNAAGGINARFAHGALMIIDDHINFTGAIPWSGRTMPHSAGAFPTCPRSTHGDYA